MQVICCRCGKRLSGESDARVVSHGLCDACALRLLSDLGLDVPLNTLWAA